MLIVLQANEERAKAAEYGLVLLEEKQQLQYKMEELISLYETSKQELETSTMVREKQLLGANIFCVLKGFEECV